MKHYVIIFCFMLSIGCKTQEIAQQIELSNQMDSLFVPMVVKAYLELDEYDKRTSSDSVLVKKYVDPFLDNSRLNTIGFQNRIAFLSSQKIPTMTFSTLNGCYKKIYGKFRHFMTKKPPESLLEHLDMEYCNKIQYVQTFQVSLPLFNEDKEAWEVKIYAQKYFEYDDYIVTIKEAPDGKWAISIEQSLGIII